METIETTIPNKGVHDSQIIKKTLPVTGHPHHVQPV